MPTHNPPKSTAKTTAQIAMSLGLEMGRSPTRRPVWPFIANRKFCPSQLVLSIHTGNRAHLSSCQPQSTLEDVQSTVA